MGNILKINKDISDCDIESAKEYICVNMLKWVKVTVSSDINGENSGFVYWMNNELEQKYYSMMPNKGVIHKSFMLSIYINRIGIVEFLNEHGYNNILLDTLVGDIDKIRDRILCAIYLDQISKTSK